MFDKKYEDRLRAWADFRSSLANQEDPIQTTIDFYNKAPLVNIQVDPYDQSNWLNPWELLKENSYCDFGIILGIGYTLQLSGLFSDNDFEIHISTDNAKSEVKYLLYVDDTVIGYNRNNAVKSYDLPKTLNIEIKYTLKTY
tara:strand:- start:419 stop:841 length:423 start_codon:yes stop_codon:yes gene_type:complete